MWSRLGKAGSALLEKSLSQPGEECIPTEPAKPTLGIQVCKQYLLWGLQYVNHTEGDRTSQGKARSRFNREATPPGTSVLQQEGSKGPGLDNINAAFKYITPSTAPNEEFEKAPQQQLNPYGDRALMIRNSTYLYG